IPARIDFEMGVGADANEKAITSLYLSRDGKRAAVSNRGAGTGKTFTGKIQIWTIAEKPKKVKEFGGRLIAMSPDGSRIICEQPPELDARILDVETGKVITKIDASTTSDLRYQSNDAIWFFPPPWHPNTAPYDIQVAKVDGNTGKPIGT